MTCKICAARESLSPTTTTGPNFIGPLGRFLQDPRGTDARALLEAWLDMGPKGDTQISGIELHRMMLENGLPMKDYTNFSRGVWAVYGRVTYKKALDGARFARNTS